MAFISHKGKVKITFFEGFFVMNSFILMFYSGLQKNWTFWQRVKTFPLFQPSFQRISGTNDTSFESPYIGRLESAKKLGMASS